MAVLGLRFCARAFSSCGKREPLLIAMRGPLTIAASLVAEHRLQTRRLSSCGARAQPLRGMWDPPRPGLEPMSPALAGRLSTTAPPGKPSISILRLIFFTHKGDHIDQRLSLYIHDWPKKKKSLKNVMYNSNRSIWYTNSLSQKCIKLHLTSWAMEEFSELLRICFLVIILSLAEIKISFLSS